ncbi:MAG: helix-turn-helix transcriptional regulator [Anaerolineae bacterium]|nr:helix-turn-helix transcriptional regulator [Anaerolineae bacterium]
MESSGGYELLIGARIKQHRQSQGLSMRELGRRTDLSVSFLSQVERGLVSVSISSLRKIADALDVSIMFFLDDRVNDDPIVHAGNRRIEIPPGFSDYIEVISPNLGQKAEVILAHMSPGSSYAAQPLKAPTDECIYMIQGSIKIGLDGKDYKLNPGDSVCFKGNSLTGVHCVSDENASWFWVITPPEF